jgi:tetratricopeptide (TPR) repeat protein
MPLERDVALKAAEKALRIGRIDVAIGEYVRIVEAQPRDWNSANALGDLYVRAGRIDEAVVQYTRIADHLAAEGFLPKAAALYKKILKIRPGEEHALLQSGEIAARQGLLAEAKNAFRAVAARRRARDDHKGGATLDVRIGTLDPDDLDARLGAARAAAELGDAATALREFQDVGQRLEQHGDTTAALAAFQACLDLDPANAPIRSLVLDALLRSGELDRARAIAVSPAELKQLAAMFEAAGRTAEMLELLTRVSALDPGDVQVRAGLAHAYVASGDLDRARPFLDGVTAGTDARLCMALAEIEFAAGHLDAGGRAVDQALTLDASARVAALALGCRIANESPEAAYRSVDAVVDLALAAGEYETAASTLREFVSHAPHHLVALMRLVEICVDGGLDTTMQEAQAQLADSYLETGRALEARIISEDLVAREPWNADHIERFRRALIMLDEVDPEAIIAERVSGDSPFLATEQIDFNEGVFLGDTTPEVRVTAAPPSGNAWLPAAESSPVADEVALPAYSSVEPAVASSVDAAIAGAVASSVDAAIAGAAAGAPGIADEAAADQYWLALTYKELGMIDDAIEALHRAVASASPRQRFEASSLLGTLHLGRDDMARAIEWFSRAAELPPSTADAGRAVLYDLATALDQSGDGDGAVAVFAQLAAEAPDYRDVAMRLNRRSNAQIDG